jgi:pimeloyl-ACP methyl ester carboxylesterase
MRSQEARYRLLEQQVFAQHQVTSSVRSFSMPNPAIGARTVETGRGEAIVFLHGYSLCAAHWAPLWGRLGDFRCVAVDQPGHAGTSPFDFRGVNLRAWYRDFLTGCLDNLGLESAHLVGHSQGAMQAMWLMLDAPERVKSVVAIGTPAVAFGAPLLELRWLSWPGLGSMMLGMPKPSGPYRGILAQTIGPGVLAEAHEDIVRATYRATRAPGFGTTVSRYLREMFRGAKPGEPQYELSAAELGRARQQVTVVMGEDDLTQPPVDVAKRVSSLPWGQLEWVPGGHAPWLDDADACASVVVRALCSATFKAPYDTYRPLATLPGWISRSARPAIR